MAVQWGVIWASNWPAAARPASTDYYSSSSAKYSNRNTAPRLCAAVLKKKEITKNRNVAHLRAERDSQNKRLSPPLESVVVQIAARAVDG